MELAAAFRVLQKKKDDAKSGFWVLRALQRNADGFKAAPRCDFEEHCIPLLMSMAERGQLSLEFLTVGYGPRATPLALSAF